MKPVHPGEGGYLILLCALSGLLLLAPVLTQSFGRPIWLSVFVTGVLLASVWAVARRRRQVVVLGLIAAVVLADRWVGEVSGSELLGIVSPLLMSVFCAWIAGILAVDVFSRRTRVNADIIYGGIDIYLLIGVAWAGVHLVVARWSEGAYQGLSSSSEFSDAIYFSFVTLTTLGYGDILPVLPVARMLAYAEALVGQLFIAVLLARLVAMQLSSHDRTG